MNFLLIVLVLAHFQRAFSSSASSESASGVYGFRLCANGDKIIPSRNRFVFGMTDTESRRSTIASIKRGGKLSRDEVFKVIASSVARKPLKGTEAAANKALWVHYANDDDRTTSQMLKYFSINDKFTTETFVEERDQLPPSDFEFSYFNPMDDIYLPRHQSLEHFRCGRPLAPSLYDAHIEATLQAANSVGQQQIPDPYAAHYFVRNALAAAHQLIAGPHIWRLQRRLRRQLRVRQMGHRHRMLSVRSLHQIGTWWRLRGNQTAALECFRTALVLQPTNAHVLLGVAQVNLHLHRLKEAHDMSRLAALLLRSANRWLLFDTQAAIYGRWYNGHELAQRMQRLAIAEHPRHAWPNWMHCHRLRLRISEFVLIGWLRLGSALCILCFIITAMYPTLRKKTIGYVQSWVQQNCITAIEQLSKEQPDATTYFKNKLWILCLIIAAKYPKLQQNIMQQQQQNCMRAIEKLLKDRPYTLKQLKHTYFKQ